MNSELSCVQLQERFSVPNRASVFFCSPTSRYTYIYIYITVAVDLIYVQPLSSSRPVPSGLEWKQSEARLLLFDVIHLTFEIPENFTYQA